VLVDLPRTVVVEQFEAVEQAAAGELRGTGEQASRVAVPADRRLGQRTVDLAEIIDVRRSGRREITFLGEIRSFTESDAVDQLGNQEIEVGVALAMGVRRHVDRHAADVGCKVGAVVEVEAAQEILVGLAVAGVLRNDQSGHHLQRFAGAEDRHGGQPLARNDAFAARRRDAFKIFGLGADFDGGELCRFVSKNARHRDEKI